MRRLASDLMESFARVAAHGPRRPTKNHKPRFVMNKTQAILLGHVDLSVEDKRIAKILGFFGVAWYALTTTEFLDDDRAGNQSPSKCRLICSSDTFLQLVEGSGRNSGCLEPWGEHVHS